MGIYDKLMNFLTSILFPNAIETNVFELEWDYLIILDACRCDIFEKIYRYFFPKNVSFKCIQSTASSTMEFVRRNILESPKVLRKLKNAVFVNANPMIDHVLGDRIYEMFYKYIPVWRTCWDENLGTVEPKYTYIAALKAFLKYPNKKMVVWFLQPHYPYLDGRFHYINVLGREFMNKATQSSRDNNLVVLMKVVATLIRKGYLCAGIPNMVCEYMHETPSEVTKAYAYNLIIVLKYVRKLTEILPGKVAIASDHGEAFGEPLTKLFPLRVYGHPSRIKIPSLTQIPYLIIENNLAHYMAIQKALKEIVLHNIFFNR